MSNASDPGSGPAKTVSDSDKPPFPIDSSSTHHVLPAGGVNAELPYEATAGWTTLRKVHRPVAYMFHTAYSAKSSEDPARRPVTFVFNGGPGAASAFLHMGAVGPKRVAFGPMGQLPPPPAQVVDNHESWLAFTDLVFIDPVGTGFSRALSDVKSDGKKAAGGGSAGESTSDDPKENPEFWEIDRDLDSLGEFICRFLSQHHRWTSPVFVAGESYGGFRVAKMARKLQEDHGVGLCGALLISPAIEFEALGGTDYDLTYWVELFPSLVAAAHHHGKTRNLPVEISQTELLARAESFAQTELSLLLTRGEGLDPAQREGIVTAMADLCGLPVDMLDRAAGRINSTRYCRELLREQRKLCGHYDAAITTVDPFPDRHEYAGPDPTLFSIDRLFTAGINQQLRTNLKVETELDYRLLSMEVHEAWKDEARKYVFGKLRGAMDDLRYGMSLNSHMKVFISHGHFDLVTPYFSSRRLVNLMKLTPEQQANLVTRNYDGGHMFYSWDDSRIAFTEETRAFYDSAVGLD